MAVKGSLGTQISYLEWQPISARCLPAADYTAHRLDQRGRIIADTVFENGFHIFNVFDFLRGITLDHDQVRLFSRGDGSDAVLFSEKLRAVGGLYVDRFQGSEPGFHQQLYFPLIAEP